MSAHTPPGHVTPAAQAVAALRDFGAACATLDAHAHVLPAGLVAVARVCHTLANVAAVRLEGRDLSMMDMNAEVDAVLDLATATREVRSSVPAERLLTRGMTRLSGVRP